MKVAEFSRGDIAVVADPVRPAETWEMISLEDQICDRVTLGNTETLWPETMKRLQDDPKLLYTGMRYLLVVEVKEGAALALLNALDAVA